MFTSGIIGSSLFFQNKYFCEKDNLLTYQDDNGDDWVRIDKRGIFAPLDKPPEENERIYKISKIFSSIFGGFSIISIYNSIVHFYDYGCNLVFFLEYLLFTSCS